MINQIQEFKNGITIIVKDHFKTAIELRSGGKNTVIYSPKGFPNIMYVLPAFRWEDVEAIFPDYNLGLTGSLPAFLDKNGNQRSEIFIGKYMASITDGEIVSRHGVLPLANYSQPFMKDIITQMGSNWHLMSIHEYNAILLRMRMLFGYDENSGNSSRGRNLKKPFETGITENGVRPGEISVSVRTLTGSGPVSWNHDRTEYGISDFQGNLWETLDQISCVDGQIIVTQYNDKTAPLLSTTTHFGFTSTAGGDIIWRNTPGLKGGTVDDRAQLGSSPNIEPSYVPDDLIKAALLHPVFPETYRYMSVGNQGVKSVIAGGGYNNKSDGVNSLRSYWIASNINDELHNAGHRLAFY